jgi:transcriptional regulator with XRE-family HTH domain
MGARKLRNALRKLREARGMSLVELAYKSNVSIETIRRLEREAYVGQPSLENAMALARALGVGLDDLFPEEAVS